MPGIEDFVLSMDDKDRDALWERALLPFPTRNELEHLLEYIDPDEPEQNRVRVRNQFKGQTDTVPLDLAYPAIDLAVNQSPFDTIGLEEENIQTTVIDKQQRVKSTEPVLKALKMLPVSDASSLTDAVHDSVKRWRSGGSQTIPQEFWESYARKVDEVAGSHDLSSVTADLVDYKRYYYGGKPIPESTLAENVELERIVRFGHILDNGGPITDERVDHLTGLLESGTRKRPENDIEQYLLEDFIQGAEPGFFQSFLDNRSHFGREFAGMTSYRRQQLDRYEIEDAEKQHIEKWYDILGELGQQTQEGVFVGISGIGEIVDTIEDYGLNEYGDPAQDGE